MRKHAPTTKLPVTIICPVRNCIREMAAHALYLREMATIAVEIIVVDSDSNDGTLTFLEQELAGLGVMFLNHPPGLYESWNHGITNATQPYCTIATTGDPLPPDSLRTLIASLEQFSADVVISAPEMLDTRHQRSNKKWPIHHFLDATGIDRPQPIPRSTWLMLTLGFFPGNLLSSSAGNLYRTEILQTHPFPTGFGHAGDCAWALQMSLKLNWVIEPTVKSYFTIHPPSAHRKNRSEDRVRTMTALVAALFAESEALLRADGVPNELLDMLAQSPKLMLQKALIQIEYASKRSIFPRFLSPSKTLLKRKQKSLDRLIDKRHVATLAYAKSVFLKEVAATKSE